MILVFFGLPGAGKGTQAKVISNEFNIPHLSTGEILRKKTLDKDELSEQLQEIIDLGNLVSDDLLNQIIFDRLLLDDCKSGFILDGYPRTINQKDYLEVFFKKNNLFLNYVFDINLAENIVIDRIITRSNIENRQDDKEEVIKNRISKYFNETRPLMDFYSKKYYDIFYTIDGNQQIEMITQDIMKILKK